MGEGWLTRRVQCFFGDVCALSGRFDGENLHTLFNFRKQLHPPDAPVPFTPALDDVFAVFAEFAADRSVIAEGDGGLGAQAGDVGERLVDEFGVEPFFAASSGGDCCVDALLGCAHCCSLTLSCWLTCWLYYITSAPSSRVGGLESELGEGWFLVTVVVAAVVRVVFRLCHVGRFVAAGRVYFADEGFAGSGSLVKCDVPDAALPFAPTFGSDILLNIVVGVPRFGDDGARNRVVVEADGCVGACLWVACEPVAGCFDVESAWVAPGFVDGAHDAVFDVWCDGGRVGGVLVGKVTHDTFPFLVASLIV